MQNRERWLHNDRKLAQLDPRWVRAFEDLVKAMEGLGWKPLVVETQRSRVRQLLLRSRGLSKTLWSKHLVGQAMDCIAADHTWPTTPLEFMVDLALQATRFHLATGLLWDMDPTVRSILNWAWVRGNKERLMAGLARHGHGFDPCHVEVPG